MSAVNFLRTLFLCLLVLAPAACGDKPGDNEVQSSAAIAMPDSFSAEVASRILAAGGNAVDAAVASVFTLAVTSPDTGNIGGGGFMLVWFEGKAEFIDYRETAPLDAHRDMYLDEHGDVIENTSTIGHLASGVPGTVAGMWAAHQRHGSLPWPELLEPAIELARNGFKVSKHLARRRELSESRYEGKTNFQEFFSGLRAGALFRQPELANTLQRIAKGGVDEFYKGETAKFIVAEMERGGGLISRADLAHYKTVLREPLRGRWRGYEVLSAPPPSSGGWAVIQLLRIKDFLAHEFEGLDHNSPQYIHLVAEIEKRVFADRAEYLGDPDYVDIPMDRLISDEYMRLRAQEINPREISTLKGVGPGLGSINTTHISIVDKDGNAVANTYTINSWFGSGVVVERAGFLLNNEMDDFSVKPGTLNMYGVVGDTANEIQPGKRMLSSMSPTILLRDNEVELVVGTPGGSTIFTSVFQTIVNIFDFGMTPLEAVGATRFHHQLLPPDLVTFSPTRPLPDEVIGELAERGYRAEPHFYPFGDVQVVVRDGDSWDAASDPRNRGESRVLH